MATPTQEHIESGVVRVFFVPTVAAPLTALTAAEVTAGTELTTVSGGLIGLENFVYENEPASVTTLKDNFEGKVVGMDRVQSPVLRFNRAGAAVDDVFRGVLAKGAEGYLAVFYQGTAGANPAATDKCELWKGRSTGPVRDFAAGGTNEVAKWHAGWAPPIRPITDRALT